MIFVSLGTHSQPFDRLAKGIDDYAANTLEEIIVQTGVTKYEFKNIARHFDYCQKDVMNDYVDKADVLVMQGGWGGMEEAIDKGKRVVAVPRIEGKEHIHNQEQLVRKLESLGCLKGCYDVEKLGECIEYARHHDFQPLKKGKAADTIKNVMTEWGYNVKTNTDSKK